MRAFFHERVETHLKFSKIYVEHGGMVSICKWYLLAPNQEKIRIRATGKVSIAR